MKKRKMVVFVVIALLMMAVALPTMAEGSDSLFFVKWGSKLNQYANSGQNMKSSDIYAKGKRAVVLKDDIQQATDFYILAGMNETEARSEAEKYMLEREAMYQKAISEGYAVSDQEVYNYLNELKQIINQADNKSEADAIINQFDTEEDYWEYQFNVYKKNLPIQKYVADLEIDYFQKSSFTRGTQAAEDGWILYFEAFKKNVSNSESYKLNK